MEGVLHIDVNIYFSLRFGIELGKNIHVLQCNIYNIMD